MRGGEREEVGVDREGVAFGDAVSACCLPAAIPHFLSAGGTGPFPKQLLSHSAYLWRNLSYHSMLLSAGLKILDSKCITCLAVATPS